MLQLRTATVIVTYNRREALLQNLARLKELTPPPDAVFVVDNASTDGTAEAVTSRFPHVRVLPSMENRGGSWGFAHGLEAARRAGFDLLWCLDDDGMPEHTALGELLREHDRSPGAILGCRIIPLDAPDDAWFWEPTGPFDPSTGQVVPFSPEERQRIRRSREPYETCSVALLGMMIPADVLDRVGVPDASLFVSNDDVELCLRAKSRGVSIRLVPLAIVRHPPMRTRALRVLGRNRELIVMNPQRLYYYVRNILAVNPRYMRGRTLLRSLGGVAVTMVGNVAASDVPLSSLRESLRGMRHGLMAWRKAAQ